MSSKSSTDVVGVNNVQTCLACGNNPTSHFLSKLDTALLLIINPLNLWFMQTLLGRISITIVDSLFAPTLYLGTKFGFLYFVPIPADMDNDRGMVLFEEATKRGYKMEALQVFGRLHDTYRLTFFNGKSIIFEGLPRLDRVNALTCTWMDDKALMKIRLKSKVVAVSEGQNVTTWREAKKVFERLQKPVIIKPRFGSRGRHTTTNVNTLEEFKKAYVSAKQLCSNVIVEEHLVGSVYRATCIDGKLAGVLAGDPPRITGDGVHTIAQLIEQKNENRPQRVGIVKITDKLHTFLARQNYTLYSIIPAGLTIDTSEKIGLSYGGCSREVTDVTHPKLVVELEKAARAVGDPLLGFDFITTDVSVDPSTTRWGIIECNSVPFINLHHDPLIGTPVIVAGILLDYIERELKIK